MSRTDRDKLRSIRQGGKTAGNARIRPLEGERDLRRGYQIESQDGRVGVVVRPRTLKTKVSVRQ